VAISIVSLTIGTTCESVASLRRFAQIVVAVLVAATATGIASAGSPLPLHGRVLHSADLNGLVAAPVYVTHSASAAASKQPLSVESLRADGFVAMIREDFSGSGMNNAALSLANQFQTPADAAKAAAAVKAFNATTGPWTYFAVPGIPRAYGFMQSGSGGSGYNIVFADGAFQYLVGIGSSATKVSKKTQATLVAAAHTLYKRVHARPAA
jgi:hypothetical protein